MNYKSIVNFLIELDYRKCVEKQSGIKLYAESDMNPVIDYILRNLLK